MQPLDGAREGLLEVCLGARIRCRPDMKTSWRARRIHRRIQIEVEGGSPVWTDQAAVPLLTRGVHVIEVVAERVSRGAWRRGGLAVLQIAKRHELAAEKQRADGPEDHARTHRALPRSRRLQVMRHRRHDMAGPTWRLWLSGAPPRLP